MTGIEDEAVEAALVADALNHQQACPALPATKCIYPIGLGDASWTADGEEKPPTTLIIAEEDR